MDKYVLLGHDQYDAILKKSKNTSTQSSTQNHQTQNSGKSPPPGIPPSDTLARDGIDVSDQEAEDIANSLTNPTYNVNHQGKTSKLSSSQYNTNDWKLFWRESKK